MSVETIVAVDVAVRDPVQLSGISSAGGIDGDENRPGDAAANEADEDDGLQKSQIQIAIERLISKYELVVERPEAMKPVVSPSAW